MANVLRYGHRLPLSLPTSLVNSTFASPLLLQCTQSHPFGTATRSAGAAKEEPHQLRWPPSSEALAANPALAHVIRTAARSARANLASNLQKLLKRPPSAVLSRQDLQYLKDVDIVNQLRLLGEQASGPRSRLLDDLYRTLQKHQPTAALDAASDREPSEPAEQDQSAMSMEEDKAEFARVASPMEIADMLVAAKADDVCILDVSSLCGFTEHMVLATGRSHRHIQAAAHAVAHQISLRCFEVAPGIKPNVEGQEGADWCVVDAGSIIVHVFSEDARSLYDLDSLWRTAGNMVRVEPAQQTAHTLQTLDTETSYNFARS